MKILNENEKEVGKFIPFQFTVCVDTPEDFKTLYLFSALSESAFDRSRDSFSRFSIGEWSKVGVETKLTDPMFRFLNAKLEGELKGTIK